jgi:DNA-binding response OmpR family regulator
MACILSTSYDEALLKTRGWLLEREGFEVTSALGFHDAIKECGTPGFDIFILGHSIPQNDKRDLVACFRASNPNGVIIALTRANEPRMREVDAYVNPGIPEDLVRLVRATVSGLRRVK